LVSVHSNYAEILKLPWSVQEVSKGRHALKEMWHNINIQTLKGTCNESGKQLKK